MLGSEHDILCLDLKNLTRDEVLSFKFSSFEVAYKIYYWFARFNGFAARKGQVVKDTNGEVVQQTYLCYREGFKQDKRLTTGNHKHDVKPETRYGCKAHLIAHVDI